MNLCDCLRNANANTAKAVFIPNILLDFFSNEAEMGGQRTAHELCARSIMEHDKDNNIDGYRRYLDSCWVDPQRRRKNRRWIFGWNCEFNRCSVDEPKPECDSVVQRPNRDVNGKTMTRELKWGAETANCEHLSVFGHYTIPYPAQKRQSARGNHVNKQ